MRLELKIASRFLRSNLGQTILITLGIAIGISVQIFIGSLIQGLQIGLVDTTIGSSSQITVMPASKDERISDYQNVITDIKASDNRITTVIAANDNPAFLEVGSNNQSLLVRGFDIKQADQIYKYLDSIKEGTYPKNNNEIILGVDLKKEYNLNVNDQVKLITTSNKEETYKVVGFYDLKVAALNKGWGIVTLEDSNRFFNNNNTISSIEMQVDSNSVFKADEIATTVMSAIDKDKFKVDNWKQANEQLLSGLNGQSISSLMIQVFVMISVILGISSVLTITVLQKSRQIGILKALGIKNKQASKIFILEGLILGILGAILGIIFGLGLSFAFTKFALNPDGTPVIDLYINYQFIMLSGLIAVIACCVASLIPAIKSSKLNPIDIIRNN